MRHRENVLVQPSSLADKNIAESRGLTASDLAIQQGNVEALEMLEQY